MTPESVFSVEISVLSYDFLSIWARNFSKIVCADSILTVHHPLLVTLLDLAYYHLYQGGYVFGGMCGFICLVLGGVRPWWKYALHECSYFK